jgi:hypothetical protein
MIACVEARSPPVSMIDKVIGSAKTGRASIATAIMVASDSADSRADATGQIRIPGPSLNFMIVGIVLAERF